MDGIYNLNSKINDVFSVCFHDCKICNMDFDERSITFYFPKGIFLAKDGSKTKAAIVKILTEIDNMNLYISKKSGKKMKYITKYIDPIRFAKYINNKEIEIIDVMSQGKNHFLWRGVFVEKNKYLNSFIEMQFISCESIQWDISYEM